jgi:hypothetical protein
MALFGGKEKETKEEKEARKERELLEKYGLQNLTNAEDIASVRKIVSELSGTGLMELGIALGGGNEKDVLKNQLYYQRAIVEQNFILIRQLDRIASLLEK